MSTEVLNVYKRNFDAGNLGFKQAKVVMNEAAFIRTENALGVIPSIKLLLNFLLKIKNNYGADSNLYLPCLLQERTFGLWDIIGGVKIRDTDSGLYDPNVGNSSLRDWYTRRSEHLYINPFKTQEISTGKTCDFLLTEYVRQIVHDYTLAPEAVQSNRNSLVGVSVGGPKQKDKPGLPLPASSDISSAFAAVDLAYITGKSDELKKTAPRPTDIWHAQNIEKIQRAST